MLKTKCYIHLNLPELISTKEDDKVMVKMANQIVGCYSDHINVNKIW